MTSLEKMNGRMKLEVDIFDHKLGRNLANDFFGSNFKEVFCGRKKIAKFEVKNFDLKIDGGVYGRR